MLHRHQNTLVNQTIARNRQITLMAMACPGAAILPRPTGRATVQVNQVKLTPVTMRIICQEAGQNVVRIRALLQAFKTTNPQVGVGVSLGGDSTNPRADVGDSGSNGQMARGNGHTKAAIAGVVEKAENKSKKAQAEAAGTEA